MQTERYMIFLLIYLLSILKYIILPNQLNCYCLVYLTSMIHTLVKYKHHDFQVTEIFNGEMV